MDGASDGIDESEIPEGPPEPPALEGTASGLVDEPSPVGEPPSAETSPEPTAPREAGTPEARKAVVAKGKSAKKKWRREPGLALSFRKGLPIEGRVEKVIRGGYEVRVGKARGFCPHSQMDLLHVNDPEEHVGRTYLFKATQLRRGGEEVILSRRSLLEEERSEEAKAVRATLVEGSIMQGHVARLTDFGAFVDLGAGVTGLVHVSEVTHARLAHLSDLLKTGDTVQVKILKLDEATGRVSLSIRQAAEDPWKSAAGRYEPGQVHPGVVRRLVDFGAFVEMSPGVEALASSDGFPPGPGGWQDGLEAGQSRAWRVVSVDLERRRMSVQPALDQETPSMPATLEPGAKLKGRVQKVERFGVFVWLGPGRVGLVPSVHTGTRRGTDLTTVFPAGKEVEVEVVEANADLRRIRLAVPGAVPKPAPLRADSAPRKNREKGPTKPKRAEAAAPPPQGFGTSLGDALREAFKKGAGES